MGFKEIKKQAIDCIKCDHIKHIERDLDKNLFADGLISSDEMIKIISSCNGDCYECSKHHFMDIDVHILKPNGRYDGLYVKFFFIEPDVIFISVHK